MGNVVEMANLIETQQQGLRGLNDFEGISTVGKILSNKTY
jgi:hypothetical protein